MKQKKQPAILIDRVKSATSSVELIGYLEDSSQMDSESRNEIIAEIQIKLAEFSKHRARVFVTPKRIRHMGQLYSRAGVAQVEQTNPDYSYSPTGGKIIDDLLKKKNASPQSPPATSPQTESVNHPH